MWKRYLNTQYEINKDGLVRNIITKHILTPTISKLGYVQIRLSIKNKSVYRALHKIVYQGFFGKIKKGYQIHHKDGIKTNNALDNLVALSPKEHQKITSLSNIRGESVNTSKLTEGQVLEIRKRKATGENSRKIADEYGMSKSAINRIANGKTWKHLPVYGVDNSVWGNRKKTGAMTVKTLTKKYGDDYFSKIAKGKKFIDRCPTCGQIIK